MYDDAGEAGACRSPQHAQSAVEARVMMPALAATGTTFAVIWLSFSARRHDAIRGAHFDTNSDAGLRNDAGITASRRFLTARHFMPYDFR